MTLTFPFAAIVGQDDMTLAIQVVAVDPSIGGVLVLGDRGTGKSTAVRALADLGVTLKGPLPADSLFHAEARAGGAVVGARRAVGVPVETGGAGGGREGCNWELQSGFEQ